MVQPVTLMELGMFLQQIAFAFSDVLFLSFVLMLTGALVMVVKRLFLEGNDL